MSKTDTTEIVVTETPDQDHITTCSLVLSAVNIPHTVSRDDNCYIIYVNQGNAEDAIYHLQSYEHENKNWPPPQDITEQNSSSIQPPTLFVVGALMLFYNVTGPWSEHSNWFNFGAGNSTAILTQGEYYRLITALTLHADLTHLLGNIIFGGFLLHFFCRITGPGIGLMATLVSATLGNLINVQMHGTGHLFVGFSTAVFAIIGMFSMLRYRSNRKFSRHSIFLPLMAGAALLAMTGSSGERTDLGAHFFGLLSGIFIGRLLITNYLTKLRTHSSLQLFLSLLSALLVYLSWENAMVKVY